MGKILVVCQHFWPENFRINDLCDGFIENSHQVEVLCGIPNYPTGEWFPGYGYKKNRRQIRNSIKIRRVAEIRRKGNTNIRIFLNYLSFPFASLFHLPYLLSQNYDKIFLYQLSPVMMSIAGILLGKIKKIETTMYVLDLWPENLYSVLSLKNKFLRSVIKSVSHWHYRNVDKIVATSARMHQVLRKISELPEEKITTVSQHCEKIYEREIEDIPLKKRFSTGFNLVYTGNISPAQSFETILNAAVSLADDGITDINWIIVGDGMSRQWLEKEVEKVGLKARFFFEGMHPIEDIPKYTAIADGLVACLAKSDLLDCTIPAKVMSYLAAGRPLLLAMDGESMDLVHEARCGFAGHSGDAAQLYRNIRQLYAMANPERKMMGANAKAWYLDHFERNKSVKKILDFVNS